MSSFFRTNNHAQTQGPDNGPRRPRISDLPPELLQCVTDHLTRSDLKSLAAVDRATRASVKNIPHESLRPPSGFQLPPLAPSTRTLASDMTRQKHARYNMARGLGQHSAFGIPERVVYLQMPNSMRGFRNNLSTPFIETRKQCLVSLEAVTPSGLEIRAPATHADQFDHPLSTSLKDYIALTAERTRHGAIVYSEDATDGPIVFLFERGQKPKSFLFSDFLTRSRHPLLTFCSLGADGTTASTISGIRRPVIEFWRLKDSAFRLEQSSGPLSNELEKLSFGCCPITGRIATLDEDLTLTLRDPQSNIETQTTLKTGHGQQGNTKLRFSPDGRGLLVATNHPFALRCVSLYSTSPGANGTQAIVLRTTHEYSALSKMKAYWHLDRSGTWLAALEDLNEVSNGPKQPTRKFHFEDHTNACVPPSRPQLSLRESYTKDSQKRPSLDLQGRDEDGNKYHLLDRSAHRSPWLYRIAAETGNVSRTPFDKLLANQIQLRAVPGSLQWSSDRTAVQFIDADQRVLRYIDFGQESAKVKLKSSRLRSIFDISLYTRNWVGLCNRTVATFNSLSQSKKALAIGATISIFAGLTAAGSFAGVMLRGLQNAMIAQQTTYSATVGAALFVGSLAVVFSSVMLVLGIFVLYETFHDNLKERFPEPAQTYSLDSLIARGNVSVSHHAGPSTIS